MKRLTIFSLILLAVSCLSTRMMLSIYPQMLTSASLYRIAILLVIFLYPLLWGLGKLADDRQMPWFQRLLFIGLTGSILAWGLQLVELRLYHMEIDYTGPLGLFGDEFVRTYKFIFPALLVAEVIWLFVKERSVIWVAGLAALIFIPVFYCLIKLGAVDEEINDFPQVAAAQSDKPNIILILADDLGYNDISLHGNDLVATRNIDNLAKNGVDFERAYASASVCAPSRAGLLTGYYQQRFGFEYLPDPFEDLPRTRLVDFQRFGHKANFSPWYRAKTSIRERGLDPTNKTLADYLKEDGYATAVIGKWHMGAHPRFNPHNFGFDEYYGINGAASLYSPIGDEQVVESRHPWDFADFVSWQNCRYHVEENGRQLIPEDRPYLTDYLTDKALAFIEANRSNRFFLHMAYTAPHGPFQALKTYYDRLSHIKDHNRRVYYAMIQSMDESIGKIVAKLKEQNLLENTLIIFTSDNGGATYTRACDNSPFYGGKMSDFEGGLVVPMIMQWPDKIPSGERFGAPVSLLDIVPSVMEAIDHPDVTNEFDGSSLLPALLDTLTNHAPESREFFWRTGYVKATIQGNWKLLINEKYKFRALYDLANDPGETKNLDARFPEKVKELEAAWNAWSTGMKNPVWGSNADVAIPATVEEESVHYFFPW